jgi:hypothetical protein
VSVPDFQMLTLMIGLRVQVHWVVFKQASTGKFFGMSYSGNSVWHDIVETYAGSHDFLNSWAYNDATGYIRNLNGFERTIGAFTNPLNVVIATPIAVPSAFHPAFNSGPTIIYGLDKNLDK